MITKLHKTSKLTFFVAGCDRDGNNVDLDYFVKATIRFCSRLGGGGATVMRGAGCYLNPENGELIEEPVAEVTTSMTAEQFEVARGQIDAFVEWLGSASNQSEILYEFDGTSYRASRFPESAKIA